MDSKNASFQFCSAPLTVSFPRARIEVHLFLRESPRPRARATGLNSAGCQSQCKPLFEQDYGLFSEVPLDCFHNQLDGVQLEFSEAMLFEPPGESPMNVQLQIDFGQISLGFRSGTTGSLSASMRCEIDAKRPRK